ncbi:MAG: hypothetical protein LBF97_04585 [Elusimicrobiota bacterium]|jgi:hypothetical protein|nr:hypothetical protein [Elusimicrobiota bacterium]
MLDLTGGLKNNDLELKDTNIYRAKNLFDIQQGSLHYFQDWGIDLEYFFSPDLKFQNESFATYLQQKITEWGMIVESVKEILNNFLDNISIKIESNINKTNMI